MSRKKRTSEYAAVPASVQQTIPINKIYADGIFELPGGLFSMTYSFTDINYAVASKENKQAMFFQWSDVLNMLDSNSTAKLTIICKHINVREYGEKIMIPSQDDGLQKYRDEYNNMLLSKISGANSMTRELYLTITVARKDIEEARTYFQRTSGDLSSQFLSLGSACEAMTAAERLRVLHDFYRAGEELNTALDLKDLMKKGRHFKDAICPQTMEPTDSTIKMDGKIHRVLMLTEYANYMKDSFLSDLCSLGRDMVISMEIQPVSTEKAVKIAERLHLGVETNIANWQRKQNANNNFSAIIPYDMEQQRKESLDFLNDLTARDQKMFLTTLLILYSADDGKQLNSDTKRLRDMAEQMLCKLSVLKFQQLDALNTVLPIGVDKIDAKRTLTTESLAVHIPFQAQEIMDKGGMYHGENAISHSLIVVNRGNLLNPSAFLLGVPGSGKSMTAKMMIDYVAMATKDHVLIYDPEGEYAPLVKALGGVNLDLTAGGNVHINAMDMSSRYGDRNPIVEKTDFILSFFERIADGSQITPKEKSVIDRCTAIVYEDARDSKETPTLRTLHRVLMSQPEQEGEELALMLERYSNGSLDMFSHPTNIDVHSRIVSFNVRNLPEQLKDVGQLMITDHMLNRVSDNFEQKIRTHIFLDEFHTLLQRPYSALFFDSAYRRFRKRDGWVNAMTQNVEYVLDSLSSRTMLSNSEFVLMLSQAPRDQEKLADLLHISEQQMKYIRNAKAGNGLLRVGKNIVPFINQFPKDTELYRLMTTKPEDRLE